MEKGKEEKLIIGGLDVGNGYMKGEFMTDIGQPTEIIDFPSVATVFTFPTDVKAEGDGIPKTVEDIYNRMDISISSSLVRDGNRRLIGKRAIKNRTIVEDFDVNTMLSKAEQELSAVLTLATFAASSLKSYFRQYGKLPERTLETEVRCVLALPVAEYMKFKEMYEKKLKQGTHLVTFHNFIDPVRVELKFSAVKMTAEGATAQFAISMEKEIAEKADRNKEFTPEYLQNSSSVIGIDIGEGTVNYVVTHDREFAPEVSSTMTTGYGTILDKCVSERLP